VTATCFGLGASPGPFFFPPSPLPASSDCAGGDLLFLFLPPRHSDGTRPDRSARRACSEFSFFVSWAYDLEIHPRGGPLPFFFFARTYRCRGTMVTRWSSFVFPPSFSLTPFRRRMRDYGALLLPPFLLFSHQGKKVCEKQSQLTVSEALFSFTLFGDRESRNGRSFFFLLFPPFSSCPGGGGKEISIFSYSFLLPPSSFPPLRKQPPVAPPAFLFPSPPFCPKRSSTSQFGFSFFPPPSLFFP